MRLALCLVVACGGGASTGVDKPSPPDPATAVEVQASELQRLTGDDQFQPVDLDRLAMQNAGVKRAVGHFRICVGTDGKVASWRVVASTGLPNFDRKILQQVATTWTFAPPTVDGAPVAACIKFAAVFEETGKIIIHQSGRRG